MRPLGLIPETTQVPSGTHRSFIVASCCCNGAGKQVGPAWSSLCTKLGNVAVRKDSRFRGEALRLRVVLRKTIVQDCIEK